MPPKKGAKTTASGSSLISREVTSKGLGLTPNCLGWLKVLVGKQQGFASSLDKVGVALCPLA